MSPHRTAAAVVLLLALWAAPRAARADAAAPDTTAGQVTAIVPPPSVRAWQVGLLRPDRLEHASLSFTLGLGAGLLSRRPAAAAGAFAVGLAKEVRDRRHGGFDAVDLLADALGTGLAAFATWAADR